MTRVQVRYELERPLDERLMERIAAVHSIYGILRVQPATDFNGLVVEYDASRLTGADVDAALRRAGVPVVHSA